MQYSKKKNGYWPSALCCLVFEGTCSELPWCESCCCWHLHWPTDLQTAPSDIEHSAHHPQVAVLQLLTVRFPSFQNQILSKKRYKVWSIHVKYITQLWYMNYFVYINFKYINAIIGILFNQSAFFLIYTMLALCLTR